MVRTGATLVLLGLLYFLAIAPWESCEQDDASCAPACHLLCKDGCTQTPLSPPQPQVAPLLSRERPAMVEPRPALFLATQPELPPPRR